MLYLVCSLAQKLLSRISRQRCCNLAEPLQSTPQIPVAACVPRHEPVKRSCQSGTADLTTGHGHFSINTWSFKARTFWRLNPSFVNTLMGQCVASSVYRSDDDSKNLGPQASASGRPLHLEMGLDWFPEEFPLLIFKIWSALTSSKIYNHQCPYRSLV